ncbi:hypothetical protein EGW08_021301 [Elysia chlorotica]|uniref:Uncharacterized protein n=1 Tax=Elysia chlorotica TaxID=188477 RepID=A0A433SNY6_ELYCH|nr:hypothetical protein EGW08_021301 [Elysia chlorotica]
MLVMGYSCVRSFTDQATTPSTDTPSTASLPWSGDSTDKQRTFPTAPGYPDSKSDSKDKEEIGLIIGCALASFITVVFLIIAIVMVIRRLLQNDEKEGRDNALRTGGDCASVCIKLDCLPCIGRSETSRQNSNDLRMRKKLAFGAGCQSDQSKLRVAPVGEESMADQASTLSEGQDSISSGSSSGAEERQSFQLPQQHDQVKPQESHGDMQQCQQHRNARKDTLKQGAEGKKGKSKSSNPITSSREDQDNENTLPSSSNRNLALIQNEIIFSEENNPAQVKSISSPSQHTFDAVAIPNTLGRSAC